jgi:hypothetical protein
VEEGTAAVCSRSRLVVPPRRLGSLRQGPQERCTDCAATAGAPQVLVDAPGMVRGVASMKRLALTDIKLTIQRIPKKTLLTKALAEASTCSPLHSPVPQLNCASRGLAAPAR